MVGTYDLATLRDHLELMMSISPGDSYVDSSSQLRDIRAAYEATAYAHDWPQLLYRRGIVKVANLDRYALPSDFRKARTVKLDNVKLREVELEFLQRSRHAYAIDQQQDDIIIRPIPSAASTAYTFSNSESAGNAVTIELDTVSGLTQLEEIWVDSVSGTDEMTMVSSINTSTTAITARLDAVKSASDILYRQSDIIDLLYYRTVNTLSATTDTTLLPPALDLIMLKYAVYLAYNRLEEFAKAKASYDQWKADMAEMFVAFDKSSTGTVTQFSI